MVCIPASDDKKIVKDFGEFITAIRKARGLYQADVAKMLEISQPYYSGIENGTKTVPFPLALKICEVLRIDFNEFLKTYKY